MKNPTMLYLEYSVAIATAKAGVKELMEKHNLTEMRVLTDKYGRQVGDVGFDSLHVDYSTVVNILINVRKYKGPGHFDVPYMVMEYVMISKVRLNDGKVIVDGLCADLFGDKEYLDCGDEPVSENFYINLYSYMYKKLEENK